MAGHGPDPMNASGHWTMLDLIFILLGAGGILLMAGYAALCAWI